MNTTSTEAATSAPRSRLLPLRAAGVAGLTVIATVAALSGCSAGGGSTSNSVTITGSVWGDWTYVFNAAKSYHKAHPNVTVKLNAIPNGDYFNKIPQLFSSGDGPDFSVVPKDSTYYPRYVGQGLLASLDDVWKKSGLDTNALDTVKKVYTSADGNKYAISAGATVVPVVYYNTSDFEKAGITAPPESGVTTEQFDSMVSKLTKAGLAPLSAGFGEGGQAPFRMFAPYIREACGTSWLESATAAQPDAKIWSDPCIAESLKVPQSWKADGVFSNGAAAATTTEAVALSVFQAGKASMTIDGTWAASQISTAAPGLKVGWFLPPTKTGTNKPIFSTVDALAANKKSKNLSVTKDFLTYVAKQSSIWQHGIPPRSDLTAPDGTNPIVIGVYKLSTSDGSADDLVQSTPTAVYSAYNSAAQAVIAGTKTPAEAAKDIAAAASS